MDEITAKSQWLPEVEWAFNELKNANATERAEYYEVIREDQGALAERALRQRLAAHDALAKPVPKPVIGPAASAEAKPIRRATFGNAEIGGPKPPIAVAPSTALVPKPEQPVIRFAGETPKGADAPPLLSQAAPYDTAKEYARRNCFREGVLTTYFWQGEFWEWNGRYYEALPLDVVRDRIYAFLDASQKLARDEIARFRPTQKHVNDVIDALKSGLTLHPKRSSPMWIDTGEPAHDILVFRNSLANVVTGERMPLTPRLWVHSGVNYDYDPEAKCPEWERFLEQVFPDDRASQDFIEEWLGYGMTEETKFEKAAMWIGPRRSGKGTIAFVQRKLIGDDAYVGLSFSTWLSNENSASCMIGKRVGVFPDIRFKPGKHFGASYDAGGITHTSAEMLLKIIGQDHLTLGRKYLSAWHGQLRLKLVLISNVVLNFNDATLPWRFVKINFTQSFYGNEDVNLRNKLAAEISGIAIRCIAAYRRLIARGHFIQPQSGIELEQKVMAESDPYTAFVNDLFVIAADGRVDCSTVKMKFEQWCNERGRFDILRSTNTPSLLTQRLKNVPGLEGLRTYRPHGCARQYVGLRLKSKEERDTE